MRINVGNALRIRAAVFSYDCVVRKHLAVFVFAMSPFEQLEYEGHPDKLAVLDLSEICGAGIGVDICSYLVDTWQRVKYPHCRLGIAQLIGCQHETILYSFIFLFIEEALFLDACHIEHVEFAHHLFERLHLPAGNAEPVAHLLLHVAGQTKFIGRDEYHVDTLEFLQCLYELVHGASEFEVAAETDGEVVESPYLALDGKKVCECLGRMGVRAVAGVDHGCVRM